MKAAIFYEDDKLCGLDDDIKIKKIKIQILNIEVEKKQILKTEYFIKQDINFVSLWLLSMQIEIVFVSSIEEKTNLLFRKMRIIVNIIDKEEDSFTSNS
ncbi:MAG: hypothetical protein LBT43_18150 [Prevotella sp.]|jgi:hypothetical protein|nr:hypothetical protein [Prevotella sp.]